MRIPMHIGYRPAALNNLKLISTAITFVLTVVYPEDESPEGRSSAIPDRKPCSHSLYAFALDVCHAERTFGQTHRFLVPAPSRRWIAKFYETQQAFRLVPWKVVDHMRSWFASCVFAWISHDQPYLEEL
jgi:hypothetical protein